MGSLPLHWKIIIGLISGIIYGIISSSIGIGQITSLWIAPFGVIFINLLKLIAVPLVLCSLITGVASLSDLKKLSKIGGKTILMYIFTTAVSVIIGLIVVNTLKPGNAVPNEIKKDLKSTYIEDVIAKTGSASKVKERGVLQPLVDMIPDNFFSSASNNRNMLQIVFTAIFIGIGLIQLPKERSKPLIAFFSSLNDVIIKLVEIIMQFAPIGVFALVAQTINKVAGENPNQLFELLGSLGFYMITVILGLIIHMWITYLGIIKLFTSISIKEFFKGIAPAQLLAFSTSSSGATLPVTMEQCEKELDVPEDVSSFVLPLGATINMDGTALYECAGVLFISQVLGAELEIYQQFIIVITAFLASIGTAAIPSAGLVMIFIVLDAVGLSNNPEVPIIVGAMLAVDRPLDMFRTVINITSDSIGAVILAKSENEKNLYKKL